MKAARIHEFGGPEVLTYEEVPDLQPRKDQVLVRVRACSLNHLDLWVRKGLPGVKLPHILGSDIAGEVVEVGEYVGGFKTANRGCQMTIRTSMERLSEEINTRAYGNLSH